MRFSYENQEFIIEFERQERIPVSSHVQIKRPFTTARLLKVTGPGKLDKALVREYTVGCNYKDQFTYESGRKAALTLAMYDAPTKGGGKPLMGLALSKEFRTTAWNAYHGRSRG